MIRNIKLRIKLKKNLKFQSKKNYMIRKIIIANVLEEITLTVYRSTVNTIHVTGIKSFKAIALLKKELSQYLKIQNISHVIDLIFYMDKRSEICNLNKFYRILEEKFSQDYHIFYCPENFVGIQLIPRYKQKKLPTVLFFSSCTSIYLSKRNLGLLIPIKNKMNKIINDYISEQY